MPNAPLLDIQFERLVYNTLCLQQCKTKIFGIDRMSKIPSADTIKDFESMKPYDYLQLCLFQVSIILNAKKLFKKN